MPRKPPNDDDGTPIFGFAWSEIQAMQRGEGRPRRMILGAPAPLPGPTAEDRRLLAEHGMDGLRALGMNGVLDRLSRDTEGGA